MSLPYDFDEDIKRIKAVAKEPGSLRTNLLKLEQKEFNRLGWSIGSVNRLARDMQNTFKAAEIERKNDYPKMIRNARKIFDDIDIAILERLDDELAYYTQYLADEAGGQDLAATKKSLKRLKRKGLIHLQNGLLTEDGETAGSGWMPSGSHTTMRYTSPMSANPMVNCRYQTIIILMANYCRSSTSRSRWSKAQCW